MVDATDQEDEGSVGGAIVTGVGPELVGGGGGRVDTIKGDTR